MVHCEDFAVLGWITQLDWLWTHINNKLQPKHRGRIGPEETDWKDTNILIWTDRGVTYEAGQRHVEIWLQEVGLEDHSKPIGIPIDRSANDSRIWNAIVN